MRLSRQFQTCLFISSFLRKDFKRAKTRQKHKPTNKTKISEHETTKATIFRARKNFSEGKNRLFCILVLFYAQNHFVK